MSALSKRRETTRPVGIDAHAVSRQPLLPGELIDGYLRVIDELGSGGMGTVYLAHDERLDRQVAVKLVRADYADDAVLVAAFLTEARVMASIRHPNVVAVHGLGQHGLQPYLAMEYVAGSTLAIWHRRRGTLSPTAAMTVLEPLCRGVQAIHDAGALHRDLKPSNVLVGHGQRVVIADFGLARPAAATERDALFLSGTPAYMAPELMRDLPLDARVVQRIDVYALGVIAYELLTGRHPFPGPPDARAPIPLPSADGRLHAAFDLPLVHALAVDPELRTASASVLLDQLREAARHATEGPARLRILLVDDDIATLTAMREVLLDQWPHAEVATLTDPVSALEVARRETPHVVVTDLHMPSGGGDRLVTELRADPRTAKVPIIVVTGFGGGPDWERLRALGATRFLVKPVDIEALVGVMQAVTTR